MSSLVVIARSHFALAVAAKLVSCFVANDVPSEDPLDGFVGKKLGVISMLSVLGVGVVVALLVVLFLRA